MRAGASALAHALTSALASALASAPASAPASQADTRDAALQPIKPAAPALCDLEVNRTGMWRKVLEFDASSEAETHYMRSGVGHLCAVDAHAAFRVVTRGTPKVVLQNYSHRHGWTDSGKPA